MPPTDDDSRAEAERALIALDVDLDRALDGPEPSREKAREIARQYRDLYASAATPSGNTWAEARIHQAMVAARQKIIAVFGTSGWERAADVVAAEGPGDPAVRPLTDAELAELESTLDGWADMQALDARTALRVRRALAELRNLRVQVAKLDRRR